MKWLSLERKPSTDGMSAAVGHYHSSYSDATLPSITSQMSKATHWPVTSSSSGYPLPAQKCISTGTNTTVFKQCCQLFRFYSRWKQKWCRTSAFEVFAQFEVMEFQHKLFDAYVIIFIILLDSCATYHIQMITFMINGMFWHSWSKKKTFWRKIVEKNVTFLFHKHFFLCKSEVVFEVTWQTGIACSMQEWKEKFIQNFDVKTSLEIVTW